jgi:hypothetical protein
MSVRTARNITIEQAEAQYDQARKAKIKQLKSQRNAINKELRKLGVKTKKSKKR